MTRARKLADLVSLGVDDTNLDTIQEIALAVKDRIQVANTNLLVNRLNTSVIAANTNANTGVFYYSNTAGITLTLPSSPTPGDVVGFADTVGDTTYVIGRNSSNIMGVAEDLTIDSEYASFRLTYVDASTGWAFT